MAALGVFEIIYLLLLLRIPPREKTHLTLLKI